MDIAAGVPSWGSVGGRIYTLQECDFLVSGVPVCPPVVSLF